MRFGSRDDEQRDSSRRRIQPPPNYFARSTQVRLLTMVFAFMLVIVLMFEARKPDNWRWMWSGVKDGPKTEELAEPIDTRLPPAEQREADPVGTVYANDQPGANITTAGLSEADSEEDARHRVEIDAWRGILKRLDRDQRIVLQRVLRAARRRASFDASDLPVWSATYQQLDEQLAKYLQAANEAVLVSGDEVPPEQKQQLMNALRQVEVEWTKMLGRALRAVLEERRWTELERESLAGLQDTLDELALMEIRDDMVWRPAEQHAWFRLFEKLLEQEPQSLQQQSLGEVSFVQLFRQTNEYRGQVVTVKGRVELAYRVTPPKNDIGVEQYYVCWLRPTDSSDSPIVAYLLELPAGFPRVGNEHTALREDLTLTGYFFKRWAYGAKDGIRTAPLVLARTPEWHAAPPLPISKLPSPGVAAAAVLMVVLLAIMVSRLAFSASDALPTRSRLSARDPEPKQFEALVAGKVRPTPADRLRELADQKEPADQDEL